VKLTLLGTGCPVASAERYGPAQLIQDQERTVLIDCGSGVTQRLLGAGCNGAELDAIFITHLHSDHIVDLFQLIISSWHQGRDRPQRIIGPKGTQHHIEQLMALWQQEVIHRTEYEQRPSTSALSVEVEEIQQGSMITIGSIEVTAIEVDHSFYHALGFVIESGGKKMVFSGDTRPCCALERAALGADLLLHEVFIHNAFKADFIIRTEQTIANVAAYHTLSSDVGKVAQRAGVGTLVLTHFVPPGCDLKQLHQEVSRDYSGNIVMGSDLLSIEV